MLYRPYPRPSLHPAMTRKHPRAAASSSGSSAQRAGGQAGWLAGSSALGDVERARGGGVCGLSYLVVVSCRRLCRCGCKFGMSINSSLDDARTVDQAAERRSVGLIATKTLDIQLSSLSDEQTIVRHNNTHHHTLYRPHNSSSHVVDYANSFILHPPTNRSFSSSSTDYHNNKQTQQYPKRKQNADKASQKYTYNLARLDTAFHLPNQTR